MKIQWQWSGVLVFCVAFVAVSLLVWQGKAPSEWLIGLLLSVSPSYAIRTSPAAK